MRGACFAGNIHHRDTEETEEVLSICRNNPQHFYVFLTRDPAQYFCFDLPENCLCGVTVTQTSELHRIKMLKTSTNKNKFIMIEPCFFSFEDATKFPGDIFEGIDWVVFGALTGTKKIIRRQWSPDLDAIITLADDARKHNAKIYFKDSITVMGLSNIKEYPDCFIKWGGPNNA